MITIQVCVGSSCFLRGAMNVISEIKQLITEHQLDDKIVLKGNFCLERCTDGVTVMVEEKLFTGIKCDDVPALFDREVLLGIRGDS